jgi:hypothetical protein
MPDDNKQNEESTKRPATQKVEELQPKSVSDSDAKSVKGGMASTQKDSKY